MANVKTEQLGIRISPAAKALLREAANKVHRSSSNMVEFLILEYCKQNSITVDVKKSPKTKDPLPSPYENR